MALSLYDVSVVPFLQTLGAVERFLAKGLQHLQANGVEPRTICESRLHPDMLDFCFQVQSVAQHSAGAIAGCKSGQFSPRRDGYQDFADLQRLIADARAALEAETAASVNALEGREVVFKAGSYVMPFVVEDFLTSFSIPNFHFHATTAYGLLRAQGVPLGKMDYLGRMKVKA